MTTAAGPPRQSPSQSSGLAALAPFFALGAKELQTRQERAERMRHEDGATFNPFDDPSGRGTPWALEILPLPLAASEWQTVAAGVKQRAQLLEAILADLYGPQQLLQNGLLPPALVFANPAFLRPCHGIRLPGGRHLLLYAVDLYRATDGSFRVLRDHASAPAGLGYALENRIVISRVFPELYHTTQIERLAPFFHTFQQQLLNRASRRRDDPTVVLLSPGADSPIYFEQALLSRYLGFPLVEGQDLTVRNGRLYLKKLAGLEEVEAVFRHLADFQADPFALRQENASGVAGLVQVAREGQLDMVNPLGAGWVDSMALAAVLPELSRRWRGEELLLASHPAWWCGRPDDCQAVQAQLAAMHLFPALPGLPIDPDKNAVAIAAAPHHYLALAPLEPAPVTVWENGRSVQRPALLRIFCAATADGFTVMPGGLAITADDGDSLLAAVPERQHSKDIWVLSAGPVTPFSLMGSLQQVGEIRRGSDLPSRVADNLLWLGRYLERAEGLVRLLRSVYRRLAGEVRARDLPELPFLLGLICKNLHQGEVAPLAVATLADYRRMLAELQVALYQLDNPGSVAAVLQQVRESARNVRDRLSLDSWRVINRLEDFGRNRELEPLALLDDTLFSLSSFSGLAMESMTRGFGWRFMDMGRRLERGLHQAGLIHAGLAAGGEGSQSCLEALLEVSDSIMTYRARYRTAFQLAPVLDLLLVDDSNPKSLAFQLDQLVGHVALLPRPGERRFATVEERLALEMQSAVRLLDLSDAGDRQQRLLEYLQKTEELLLAFGQQITAHYLSRVPATPHFTALVAPQGLP